MDSRIRTRRPLVRWTNAAAQIAIARLKTMARPPDTGKLGMIVRAGRHPW